MRGENVEFPPRRPTLPLSWARCEPG